MALINVIRSYPPELGRCRHVKCRRIVEWVLTTKGKRMPVDAPLVAERVVEQLVGPPVTVIDGGRSHFATCPYAHVFRQIVGRGHSRPRR